MVADNQLPTIWLAQWKCPLEHSLLSLLYDAQFFTPVTIIPKAEALFRQLRYNQCAVCGSTESELQQTPTDYSSLDTAIEALKLFSTKHLVLFAFSQGQDYRRVGKPDDPLGEVSHD